MTGGRGSAPGLEPGLSALASQIISLMVFKSITSYGKRLVAPTALEATVCQVKFIDIRHKFPADLDILDKQTKPSSTQLRQFPEGDTITKTRKKNGKDNKEQQKKS